MSYDPKLEQFYLLPLREITVDDITYEGVSEGEAILKEINNGEKLLDNYSKRPPLFFEKDVSSN